MTYQPIFELFTPYEIEKVYNDAGTGSETDVSIWRAKLNCIPDGVYMIGDVALPAFADTIPNNSVVLVKPLIKYDSGGDIIKPPVGYLDLWDDSGSGGQHNGSFWRPKAPPGYWSLGDVACNDWSEPPVEFTAKYACIRKDLLTKGILSSPALWTDKGSGSKRAVSIWSVQSFYQPTGYFKANDSYNIPDFYQDVYTLPVAKIYSWECSNE